MATAQGVELATAYVSLSVETRDLASQIGKAFTSAPNGPAAEAGRRMGRTMARAFERDAPDLDKLRGDVERAEKAMASHTEKSAERIKAAERQVEIARARSREALEKYKEGSSQALVANDKLIVAQQKLEAATRGAKSEQDKLTRELDDTKRALREAETAAERSAKGFGGAFRKVGGTIKKHLTRGVRDAGKDAEKAAKDAGKKSASSYASAFKGAVGGAAAFLGGSAAVGFINDAVQASGELEQSIGAVDAVFTEGSQAIHTWARDATTQVGLTTNEFNTLATLLGSQLKNGGVAADEMAPKVQELITLGADMSAMFGGSAADAISAISATMRGERDSIEKYGVSLTQAAIDAKAAEMGFEKVNGALSTEANQQATLALLMEQTAASHGQFAREADTFAHKQQVMAAEWGNLKARMGEVFMPVFTKVFQFIGNTAIPALGTITGALRAFAHSWIANDGDVTSSGLAGAMERIAYMARQTVDVFTDMLAPVFKVIGDIARDVLVPAFKTLAEWVRNNADWIVPLVTVLGTMAVTFATVTLAIKGTLGVIALAKFAVTGLWGVIVANPIGAVIAAIVGLVLGFKLMYERVGWFRDGVDKAWAAIKDGAAAVGRFFVTLWQDYLVVAWDGIKSAISAVATWFTGTAIPAVQTAVSVVGDVFTWLYENIVKPIWTGIRFTIAVAVGLILAIIDGLVWVYKHTLGPIHTWLYENIVKPVWSWIKDAIAAVGKWFSNTLVPGFRTALDVLGVVFRWLRDNVIAPVWNFVRDKIDAVAQWFATTLVPFFRTWIDHIANGFFWYRDNVIAPVWNFVRDKINAVVRWFADTLVPWFRDRIQHVADKLTWFKDRIITPVWDGIKTRITDAWNWIKTRAFDPMSDFITKTLPDAFGKGRDAIGTAWDGLKKKAAQPVEWVVNTVIRDGIVDRINDVLDFVDLDPIKFDGIDLGYARGGVLPGYQPAKRDDRLVPMRSGEGVLVPEAVRAIGADTIHALNAGGNSGGVAGARRAWQGLTHREPLAAGLGAPVYEGQASFRGPYQQMLQDHRATKVGNKGAIHPWWGLDWATNIWNGLSSLKLTRSNAPGVRMDAQQVPTGRFAHPGWAGMYTGINDIYLNRDMLGRSGMGVAQLRAVTAHEIGHALGLPHTNSPNSLMNPTIGRGKLAPTAYDMRALQAIYGGKNSRTPTGDSDDAGFSMGEFLMKPLRLAVNAALGLVTKAFPNNVFGRMGGGLATKFGNDMIGWLEDKIDDLGDWITGKDGDALSRAQVGDIVTRALRDENVFSEANLQSGIARAFKESGGNPRAINNWDSNANQGTPSKGLFQMIDPTFNRWAHPNHRDIWNPYDNTRASVRYVRGHYGSIRGGWDLPGGYAMGGIVGEKIRPTLFDTGGRLDPGLHVIENRTKRPEFIFTEDHIRAMTTPTDGTRGDVIVQVTVDADPKDDPSIQGRRIGRGIAWEMKKGIR